MNMQRILGRLLCVLLIAGQGIAEAGVHWAGERLVIQAADEPLASLIRDIAEQAAVDVEGLENVKGTVSLHLDRVSLREAFEELLAGVNFTLAEEPAAPGRKTRLTILAPGQHRRLPQDQGDSIDKRLDALREAAARGDKAALRAALSHADARVQSVALELLDGLDPAESLELLANALRSRHARVRLSALNLLRGNEHVDEGKKMQALSTAITDTDADVRQYAVKMLAELGGPNAAGYLRQALADPAPAVRMSGVENIVRFMPAREAISLLREAVSDQDQEVSSAAAEWLKQLAQANKGERP